MSENTAEVRCCEVDGILFDELRRPLFYATQAFLPCPGNLCECDSRGQSSAVRGSANWIPAASTQVVLVFHGNGYVMEEMVGDELGCLREIGASLLLNDYRGYGGPDETTVNEDAEAALNYLLRDRRIARSDVIVLGRSIGSGPATQLARNHAGLGGLILESPFSSIDDVSGTADTLTPKWMAEKIFAQAHQPKQLYLVEGAGHDDLLMTGGRSLTQLLQKFVRELRTGSPADARGAFPSSSERP